MDYECMNCGFCVGRESLLTHHYRERPECDRANWQAVGAPVVERCKREILEDIRAGRHPQTVASFSELHDHVDANEYGGATEGEFDGSDEACAFWNRVQNDVDAWLKAGRP